MADKCEVGSDCITSAIFFINPAASIVCEYGSLHKLEQIHVLAVSSNGIWNEEVCRGERDYPLRKKLPVFGNTVLGGVHACE